MTATPPVAAAAAPAPRPSLIDVGRIRALDTAADLHPLASLDIVPDGALNAADATAFERLARSSARAARSAPQGPQGPVSVSFADVVLNNRGGLVAGSRNSAELRELGSQFSWAAQQARIGSVLTTQTTPAAGASGASDAAAGARQALPAKTVAGAMAGAAPALARPVTPATAVAAIDSLADEAARLRAAGGRAVVTFDIDGTTLKGDIFQPFTRVMARRSMFGEDVNPIFREALGKLDLDAATRKAVATNDANANALLMLDKTGTGRADTPQELSIATSFFAVADAMKGQRLDRLRALAREFVERGAEGEPPYRLNVRDDSTAPGDSVRDVTAALRRSGIEPWTVTLGFDWLAREAVAQAGLDPKRLVGTHSEVVDGVLTGRHNGRSVGGAAWNKADMVRTAVGAPPMISFGDSGSDLPMLGMSLVRGMVVNPTPPMREALAKMPDVLGEIRYRGTVGDAPPPDTAR